LPEELHMSEVKKSNSEFVAIPRSLWEQLLDQLREYRKELPQRSRKVGRDTESVPPLKEVKT
jgi:hypothetical protein